MSSSEQGKSGGVNESSSSSSAGAGGLGESRPLVTIQTTPVVSGVVRPVRTQQTFSSASSTSASNFIAAADHPLAASVGGGTNDVELSGRTAAAATDGANVSTALPSPLPPPPVSKQQQQRPLPTPQQPFASAAGATAAPPQPPRSAPVAQNTQPHARTTSAPATPSNINATFAPTPRILSASVSPTKTLDDWVDAFLSTPIQEGNSTQSSPPVLLPDPLPASLSDLERLKCLVHRRAWGDVLLLTERMLRGASSHYAPIYASLLTGQQQQQHALLTLDSQQDDLVYILQVQCQAWLKLKRYEELGLELEQWSFCHHNDNTAPAWIPWSLHIMAAASSLLYTTTTTTITAEDADEGMKTTAAGSGNTTVDALWAIRRDLLLLLQEGDNSKKNPIALFQVEHALANAFVRLKDWRMALASLEGMVQIVPEACRFARKSFKTNKNDDTDRQERAYKCEILSRQGLIFLQLGALQEASQIFEQAKTVWEGATEGEQAPPKPSTDTSMMVQLLAPAQLSVNEGLLCFGYGRYDQALEFFRKAIQQIRGSGILEHKKQLEHGLFPDYFGLSPAQALYSETINNMSLCALYTCRLKEALLLMESVVREDPTSYLTERIALNLCTMYELSNETSVSSRKKRVLQLIAKRFSLHDIAPENFRL